MGNEILFLAISILGAAFIIFSLRLGKEALFIALVTNLILVSAVGSELISLLGVVTNAGNAFYGLAIFSLAILVEFYNKKTALRAVWVGCIGVVSFIAMTQFSIQFVHSPFSQVPLESIDFVFRKMPRIAVASLLAYLVSAHCFIWLYDVFRQKLRGFRWAGVRYLGSAVMAQLIDSVLFFFVAFWGLVPDALLLEVMSVGFVSKIVVAIISVPFFYWAWRFSAGGVTPHALLLGKH
ncbi:MAG: hypothetical protein A3D67_04455 [Candidatus Lloydbacteria bacterium RIFCSPHIGHO2_02_FULL_51_22]|uniref:Queuosine precursor transporter n=3 Tax=Candidatus Lloydiibacteriota TaxID=1817910 RepID=A0A1G2DGC3_9BACT|nr:MAG: hypothetical protein A3D67_04455 [Candidatus Lloydbacteria bacterium RIFCSPHIGHO2_02_FULL_51_22]OGZ14226.1 MAG: hypothetical protein A3J08_03555 [Candidatus Lloydbacteria bacterium RIFCSPLOWO2_02_FULL_51_11]OGZ16790.1 MAG: hypothetical protein A3G11_02890 [Candidatus Lloydbacteria bacterium RIFCSPLOWO2_12_FULL_51_9]